MAKRYHESKKHHMMHPKHEGKHMEKSHHSPSHESDIYRPERGYYEGMEGRREQEMRDAGMIREDHSAIANLPQGPMIKPYPKDKDYVEEGLDDTIRGIDGQIGMDDAIRDRTFHPKKW